jgi:transcriptional regulator with XRE-family HTH domain
VTAARQVPEITVVDSQRLRQLRRERGFSQLSLAIRAGVGLTTLEHPGTDRTRVPAPVPQFHRSPAGDRARRALREPLRRF